jgi:hypothetical protein
MILVRRHVSIDVQVACRPVPAYISYCSPSEKCEGGETGECLQEQR